MLTGRMLRVKRSDGLIQPAFVDIEAKRYRRMATDLMDMVKAHIDRSRDDLVEAIDGMIGDNVQHRAHRGLAKLLMDEFCTFGMRPGPAPEDVRKVVFRLSRRRHPVVDDDTRTSILIRAAQELGVEVGDVEELLYADLPSAHRLLSFEAPSIDALLHRYNLALAQALLYYADRVRIRVKRRPGSKLSTIARYVKLCHLMHHVRMEGDAYEFLLEGPMTLLRQTRKYGIRLATFLPGTGRSMPMSGCLAEKADSSWTATASCSPTMQDTRDTTRNWKRRSRGRGERGIRPGRWSEKAISCASGSIS